MGVNTTVLAKGQEKRPIRKCVEIVERTRSAKLLHTGSWSWGNSWIVYRHIEQQKMGEKNRNNRIPRKGQMDRFEGAYEGDFTQVVSKF